MAGWVGTSQTEKSSSSKKTGESSEMFNYVSDVLLCSISNVQLVVFHYKCYIVICIYCTYKSEINKFFNSTDATLYLIYNARSLDCFIRICDSKLP